MEVGGRGGTPFLMHVRKEDQGIFEFVGAQNNLSVKFNIKI